MNMKIFNTPEYKGHPLYPLLEDCIAANTGGSFTEKLCEATKIDGWTHEFIEWYKENYSFEKLEWNSSEVKNKLIEIYAEN